jgi:hypothetical protein
VWFSRRLVIPLAATLLSLHLLVLTGTTVVVLAAGSSTSDIVCTCAHGANHGSCPMHRTPADSARCRMQGAQDDLRVALLSMLADLTLPVASVDAIALTSAPVPQGHDSGLPSGWTVPPVAPPPRA